MSKIDYTIDFDIIDDKIFVNCPNCEHSFQLGHTEWSAILCPNCKAVLRQEEDEEESEETEVFDTKDGKAKIPCVIIAKKDEDLLEVMTPTDALLYLRSEDCDEKINLVMEGEFTIGMQKLVDILICHPEFFPCLDVAIDSDPRDRKINRLLMKAKKQPEN
tara:strand:- start:110 stop:592 length:483 start_codon:yes stop_codon:yes gene_type:complete